MLDINTKVRCIMKEDRAPKHEGYVIFNGITKDTQVQYYIVEFGNRQLVCLEDHIEEVLPVPQKSDPSKSTVRMPTPKQI